MVLIQNESLKGTIAVEESLTGTIYAPKKIYVENDVKSVNGMTGAVTLTAADVGALPSSTTSLKNPYALTLNVGSESVVYDGSEAKTVTIPDGSEVSY